MLEAAMGALPELLQQVNEQSGLLPLHHAVGRRMSVPKRANRRFGKCDGVQKLFIP